VITAFAGWLHATALGWAISGGLPWLEPTFKTLHFIGLALLFGCVGAIDLRLLGVAKGLPIGPLQRLMPFAALGFAINAVTGIGFFAGSPFQYLQNIAFWMKMLCIFLAGLNALVFYVAGFGQIVTSIGPGEEAPLGAKAVAAASLLLWIGVMYWGRMLAFLGNAF